MIFASPGGDVTPAHEIYHEDAVLEFPHQASGSRASPFHRVAQPVPGRCELSGAPVTQHEDLVVSEVTVRYDGGPPMFGIALHEFRGDKVARERIYGGEPWKRPSGAPPGARPHPRTRRARRARGPTERNPTASSRSDRSQEHQVVDIVEADRVRQPRRQDRSVGDRPRASRASTQ